MTRDLLTRAHRPVSALLLIFSSLFDALWFQTVKPGKAQKADRAGQRVSLSSRVQTWVIYPSVLGGGGLLLHSARLPPANMFAALSWFDLFQIRSFADVLAHAQAQPGL